MTDFIADAEARLSELHKRQIDALDELKTIFSKNDFTPKHLTFILKFHDSNVSEISTRFNEFEEILFLLDYSLIQNKQLIGYAIIFGSSPFGHVVFKVNKEDVTEAEFFSRLAAAEAG